MKKSGSRNWVGGGKIVKKSKELNGDFGVKMWQMWNIPLFGGSKHQVLNIIGEKFALGTKKYWIATVNPEFVMATLKDKKFGQILKQTSLNVVDGVGLVWARDVGKGKNWLKAGLEIMMGKNKESLVSGADLMVDLCKLASEKGYKVFFLGGFNNRAEKTMKHFEGLKVEMDFCPGEPEVDNSEVVKKINSFKPDILLVAYGMKKQEFWIADNLKDLDVGLVMGVGRSFDYYSGELKRAPKLVRNMGMEWLYSLLKEPKRIKRQLALPRFVWKVLTKN